jgi:hypothetical protein
MIYTSKYAPFMVFLLVSGPLMGMELPDRLNNANFKAKNAIFPVVETGSPADLDRVLQRFQDISINDIANDQEMVPLLVAAVNGNLLVVEYLINVLGADTGIAHHGQNALHKAAANGHLDVVQYLVEQCHFDVEFPDESGNIPLDLAKNNGHDQIANYLAIWAQPIAPAAPVAKAAPKAAPAVPQRPAEPKNNAPANQKEANCQICFDAKQLQKLSCSHEFCGECLNGMLDTAIRDKSSNSLKCPMPNCAKAFEPKDINTINKAKAKQILDIQAHEAMAKDNSIRHCPTPDCPYSFVNDANRAETIRCEQCKKEYCSNCLTQHAQKVSCEQAKKNSAAEKATQEWKDANTKQCPRCKTNIEKNGGCLHMTCSNAGCKHEFCWNCMKRWDSNEHTSFFSCSQPQQQRNAPANNNAIVNEPYVPVHTEDDFEDDDIAFGAPAQAFVVDNRRNEYRQPTPAMNHMVQHQIQNFGPANPAMILRTFTFDAMPRDLLRFRSILLINGITLVSSRSTREVNDTRTREATTWSITVNYHPSQEANRVLGLVASAYYHAMNN